VSHEGSEEDENGRKTSHHLHWLENRRQKIVIPKRLSSAAPETRPSYDGFMSTLHRNRCGRYSLLSIGVVVSLLVSISCRTGPDENTVRRNRDLVGSWLQIMEEEGGRRSTTVRNFFLNEHGALRVGFFEIGPKSRIGIIPDDVVFDGANIRWREGGSFFRGTVAEDKNLIELVYGTADPPTRYRFERYPEGEALWRELMAAVDVEVRYTTPTAIDDGWVCSDLGSAGLDQNQIEKLLQRIASGKYDDLHGFLLIKDGILVVEEYFGDLGRVRGPSLRGVFGTRIHHLGSTTKAVTSLLIGIAIDRGFIEGVDVPVFDFFPEYRELRNAEKDRILLRHLLTMTAGLEWEQFRFEWSDPRNDGAQMWHVDDPLEYTLAKPVVAEPGEKFEYSNGISTLLGAVIKNATGGEADEFAEEYVFRPLGISVFEWTRYPDGSIETDGGLALTPRDLANIGQLFLDGGLWRGERVVSREWISESTRTHFKFRGSAGGYGFKWQQMDLDYRGENVAYYFMPGYGGNLLAVIPRFNMVVVFTGANYDWDVRSVFNRLLEDHLLPAVR
jgi:CubicO group peptidase (beta-lactamase class C family)